MKTIKKSEDRKYTYSDYITWKDDWEIIDGVAYVLPPGKTLIHQMVLGNISVEIGLYLKGKSCKLYYTLDVVLSEHDIVRPDIIVVCDKNKITEENIKGAPDLIVEILSPETAKRDKIYKRDQYKKYGVKEYWIVNTYLHEIIAYDWVNNTEVSYFYDEEEKENFIPVAIFGNDLKLDLKDIFRN